MLYFSKIRIFLVSLFTLILIFIACSNLFQSEDSFFKKKINLGLDLQGGSYLLLEIDNDPVIEQKLQNLTSTIRNYFKDKNIREAYNAVTGLRQTRLDSKDLPPYTRIPEPADPGMMDKIKKYLGFANGGYVENAGNKKLI